MQIKSLEDLEAIRARTRKHVDIRTQEADKEIIVGMATGGIAAGARPVLQAIIAAVAEQGMDDVVISQDGSLESGGLDPVVEIVLPGREKITYARVQPDMVETIVTETLGNGNTVQEYTADHYRSSAGV